MTRLVLAIQCLAERCRIELRRADRSVQNAGAAPIGSAVFWDYFLTPREIPLSAAVLSMCNKTKARPNLPYFAKRQ